jgi:putative inorganic carbon (HCO3(-)) transporter
MWLTVLLRVLACATVALAPLEGYLLQVHGQSAKVVPALLIGVWLFSLYRQRRLPAPHPLHLLIALLAVVLLATSAVHEAEPFTLEYLVRWVPFLMITVVLADVAAREVPVRALLAATVAGAVVAAAGGLFSVVGGSLRATGPLEDPNDLAFFLVAALPLLVALPARGRSRIVLLLLGAVLVAGAAATFSRGGGIALAAGPRGGRDRGGHRCGGAGVRVGRAGRAVAGVAGEEPHRGHQRGHQDAALAGGVADAG